MSISGALSYVIERINECPCFFGDHGVELDFEFIDTQGLQEKATEAIVDLICDDIAAFIGPEGPKCATEAMVAGSKNKAMISYRYGLYLLFKLYYIVLLKSSLYFLVSL